MSKRSKLSEDTAIGIIWAAGMALGIIFINLTPGYAPDLFSYLFGNILTIPVSDLYIMVILDLTIILIVALFFKEFFSISFDEEFSTVVGIPTRILNLAILCMVALSVVILIRVVGIILIIALLTIPSSICRQFTYSIKKLMFGSIIVGIISTVAGLLISYLLNLASGATIIIFLVLLFLVSFLVKKALNFINRKKYNESKA